MSLDDIAALVFIDIAIIVLAARLMAGVARRLHQPAVIGEIIAGIALGPSLLGALPGNPTAHLFPAEVVPFLKVVAQLGLIIFMFIVGLELDLRLIRGYEQTVVSVSLSSIALPFGLGIGLAGLLHSSHGVVAGVDVEFLPFALFIGASMSVTAFPVLARILSERRMARTRIGALTLACAAVDDIMAWSLLALVLAVIASAGAWDLPRILAESALFVAVMALVVKPVLERIVVGRYRAAGHLTPDIFAVIVIGILASSYITAEIGIHQIFGAFLFGTLLPREGSAALFKEILERLETVSVLLLLPVFFMATGLDTDIRGIGLDGLPQLGAILLVACVGKFVGALGGARLRGIPMRQAAAIGTLMNTRGLTELVLLNVGLSAGVLDRQLFTMLVVMAILTTIATEPVLRLIYPDRLLARDIAEAERAAVGEVGGYRVLAAVADPAQAVRLVDLAIDLGHSEADSEVVLTRFTPRAAGMELSSGRADELAEMAASMDALHELSERVDAAGTRSALLYQFSDDIAADLLSQAATIEADVLLVGGPRGTTPEGRAILEQFATRLGFTFEEFLARLWRDARCDTAVLVHPGGREVRAGPGLPVIVALDGSRHAPAAVELAVRVAVASGAGMRIVDGGVDRGGKKRAATLAQEIRILGPECTASAATGGLVAAVERHGADAGVIVTSRGEPGEGTRFGSLADELIGAVEIPVLVVGTPAGGGEAAIGDFLTRLHRLSGGLAGRATESAKPKRTRRSRVAHK